MKKFLVFITLLFFINSSFTFADTKDEEGIIRKIITGIEWNDNSKSIVIHEVLIQKFKDTEIYVYTLDPTVWVQSLSNKTLTHQEVLEYVKENKILKKDNIFQNRVEVFKDLSSNENVTQSEIDHYIELAKIQIQKDWENLPPKQGKEQDEETNFDTIYIVVIVLLTIFAVYLVKNRYR